MLDHNAGSNAAPTPTTDRPDFSKTAPTVLQALDMVPMQSDQHAAGLQTDFYWADLEALRQAAGLGSDAEWAAKLSHATDTPTPFAAMYQDGWFDRMAGARTPWNVNDVAWVAGSQDESDPFTTFSGVVAPRGSWSFAADGRSVTVTVKPAADAAGRELWLLLAQHDDQVFAQAFSTDTQ